MPTGDQMDNTAAIGRDLSGLADIAAGFPGADIGTKPPFLWQVYEQYLAPLRDKPLRILELGIHKGVSAQALATYFRNGFVVALDLAVPNIDVSRLANLTLQVCDQRDVSKLNEIADEHAPDGFDIIIDDASHVGEWSMIAFDALFPRLKPGGLYFIEDWGTGYLDTAIWGDGAKLSAPLPYDFEPINRFNRRIASHDYGMAGFIKTLIDGSFYPVSIFEWLHIHGTVVVAKKALNSDRNRAEGADKR